jgi:hypothetical protein
MSECDGELLMLSVRESTHVNCGRTAPVAAAEWAGPASFGEATREEETCGATGRVVIGLASVSQLSRPAENTSQSVNRTNEAIVLLFSDVLLRFSDRRA